jgi:heme oxygenase
MNPALKEVHDKAENTKFSQLLINGDITEEQWKFYLDNMYYVYNVIEQRNIIELPELLRAKRISEDSKFLPGPPVVTKETIQYCTYLANMDSINIWAHIYVRYLGDLYGGSMLNIKWPKTCLEFDNSSECISYIREKCKDVDPNQYIKAFEWTIILYESFYLNTEKNTLL